MLAADPACFTSHFVQTADITLSGPWTPIGDATNKFAGTYDGAGRSISGLILPQQSYSGLFGATNGATIRNLDVSGGTAADIPALTYSGVLIGDATDTTVANVSITAAMVGVAAVGGAIGQLNGGSVAGVSVTGSIASLQDAVGGLIGAVGTDAAVLSDVSVTSGSVDGSQYVGGVIGRIYGASGDGELTITRMSSSTQVSSSVTNFWQGHVGGAIGSVERHDSSVIITESTASGPVTAITGSWGGGNVGGFAGSIIGRFAVRDTSASGDVAASYAVGGFVGYMKELYGTSSIAGSTAHGNVTAAGSIVGGIGGFLGEGDAASPRAITISQSSASGAVSAPAGTSVGGFGGSVRRSDISESHASGTVTGQYSVGGFIGSSADDIGISDSHASGAVTGEYSVGGFIGSSLNGIGITNAHSSGTVAGGSYVGGLIGRYEGSGTLSEVYATGPVSGGPTGSADGWNVGGLVGIMLNGGTIERAFSTGDVSGVTRVGGLVGELDGPASGTPLQVRDSYATGSVVGSGTLSNVGALVGINRDLLTLERVYATGAVSSSTTTTYRGGVTGVQVTSLTASSVYWNSQTTGMSYAAGTSTDTGEAITGASGLTSRQMRSSSSFVDWNFTTVWGYQCGVSSSPELRWANGQATGLTAGPCTQPGPDNGGGTTPTPVDNPPLVTENPASTTQLGDPMPGAQAPGASELVVDGAPVAVRQTRGPQGRGLALTAGALTISIDPRTASGRALPLTANGTLVVARTGELPVSGSGVAPNAPVDVTLYSTPMQIATTTSDADGAFTMQGLVPRALARGPHTLVVTSTTSDGAPFTLALGVVVTSPASALGANPRLQVQPRSVRPRHPVRMQVTAAQRLCRVTFSLGDRRKSVRADARGRAVITLAAPAKPGPVAASARVTGKGCDALVTRTRFTVRK